MASGKTARRHISAIRRRHSISPGKILDYNSGVASNRLAYENIRSHTRYHRDFGLGQCRLG
jgi:hypothetical protein